MDAIAAELEWPSGFRAPFVIGEAREIADACGTETGAAYLLVTHLAECELSDGRGGDTLHVLCTELLGHLERAAAFERAA